LPRPREIAPPCRKSVRKDDVPVSQSHVSWTEHPEYILNKAKARGDYSHIAGAGVPVFNVDMPKCDDVNVAKNVASTVSEVTHGDAQLKQGIDRVTKFIKKSDALKTDKKLLADQNKPQECKKKKSLEKKNVDNFSDVEPDDPVSIDTDENANVLATKESEKPKTSKKKPDFESVIAETVVISSDAENTDNNDRVVSSNSDADMRDIEMQVNKSLQGVTFNVIEDLIVSSDSNKSNHDFGVHDVHWKGSSAAEFVDIMNWTDQKEGMPDSTTASPIGEPLEGNDPIDPIVVESEGHELPPKTDKMQGQNEDSPDDIPILERFRRVAADGQAISEKGIQRGLEGLCPSDPDKVTPISKSVARQLFASEEESQPKVIPFERTERVDVLTVSRRKPPVYDQNSSKTDINVGDVETSEVTYHTSDPRLDNFTPYYWREKSEMRKYYSLPAEFPTIAGAARFGINFATEREKERQRQLNHDGKYIPKRSRHVQIESSAMSTRNVGVQIQVPVKNAETQHKSSVGDANTQTECLAEVNNLGLPPGLTTETLLRATTKRGTDLQWITYGIEVDYCTHMNKNFTDAERANVHAVVGLMAATRRDEDKELSQEVSHILQAGQAWDIPSEPIGEIGIFDPPMSEPPPEVKEGGQVEQTSREPKSDAINAPLVETPKVEYDSDRDYDDWD